MIKFNKLSKGVGAALLLVGASAALAETVTVPATVSVNNAIDFTFTGTLDFGEIRATASPTVDECAVLALPANPASPLGASADPTQLCADGAGVAVIQSVGGTPARPVFTVAGVAPFSNLSLTLPAAPITLSAALPPGSATFTVGEFTAYRTSGTPGVITTVIQANGTGDATFTVGAEIATHVAAIVDPLYEDGIPYTGSFDVTVEY
ncbi:MAG TPA: DUF4402 domain-containing protein [Cellvibrionaceae bacterium]